jgi:hypothetical protein
MAFCCVSGAPWRAGWQGRGELAGGEGIEGAEAGGEFASGQLAFAEE